MNLSVEKRIEQQAQRLGFIAAGITHAAPPPFLENFHSWIKNRLHGDMAWLEKGAQARSDPSQVLKGCKAIVSLAYPYSVVKPITPEGFSTARFTEGLSEDYHRRLRRLAAPIMRIIQEAYPGAKNRVCIDSAPLLERAYGQMAGIGFIGKNNMLIVPGHGSFCYLVEILTTAPLAPGLKRPIQEGCGDCEKCLEACPTGALKAPFLLDSRKCLSYLTIESKSPIAPYMAQKMNRSFFGCDVCQEACPFNKEVSLTRLCLPSVYSILEMGEEDFRRQFGKTTFWRPGLEKLKSNILAAMPSE